MLSRRTGGAAVRPEGPGYPGPLPEEDGSLFDTDPFRRPIQLSAKGIHRQQNQVGALEPCTVLIPPFACSARIARGHKSQANEAQHILLAFRDVHGNLVLNGRQELRKTEGERGRTIAITKPLQYPGLRACSPSLFTGGGSCGRRSMARNDGKDQGIFERPPRSGIWWVCYFDQKRQETP